MHLKLSTKKIFEYLFLLFLPLEKCFDTPNYNCDFYKRIGLCQNPMYKTSLLLRCPLSCGYCKPAEVGVRRGCFDKWSNCQKFLKMGLCNSLRWGTRLARNCKKTCLKCKRNRAPALLSVASPCSFDDNCCWDRSTPINGKCPGIYFFFFLVVWFWNKLDYDVKFFISL